MQITDVLKKQPFVIDYNLYLLAAQSKNVLFNHKIKIYNF